MFKTVQWEKGQFWGCFSSFRGFNGGLWCHCRIWMLRTYCLTNFEPLRLHFNCIKSCSRKQVNFEGVFRLVGGVKEAPGVTAENFGSLGVYSHWILKGTPHSVVGTQIPSCEYPPGCGVGPSIQWIDYLINFGPIQLDFHCIKSLGKSNNLGSVFCPYVW